MFTAFLLLVSTAACAAAIVLLIRLLDLRTASDRLSSENTQLQQQLNQSAQEALHFRTLAGQMQQRLAQYAPFRSVEQANEYALRCRNEADSIVANAKLQYT